ncbi:MAG TPA: acyl-CoA reductase [Cyclobacteriaceae bacterium]|nr:acyl-CoA reductase [Cyclobacteriaceae bacterium]
MLQSDRIEAFVRLREVLQTMNRNERAALATVAKNENGWFTADNINMALDGICHLLEPAGFSTWAGQYPNEPDAPATIGVAMAGNIPAVGFHDYLCVLLAGHRLKAKLSSSDTVLLKFIHQQLSHVAPALTERVEWSERLNHTDAMIATGSDNTARYFEYYFRGIPHIIRKNRSSCAVIVGEEPEEEFVQLGADIFSYFGLGCRNVSKIFIPQDFDPTRLLPAWKSYATVIEHHKYANNYDYQKSLLLLNQSAFFDGQIVLLKESDQLVSPVATVYFEHYSSQDVLRKRLEEARNKIQVIVSAQAWYPGSLAFGTAQWPVVGDYADGIDTMKFLQGVKTAG